MYWLRPSLGAYGRSETWAAFRDALRERSVEPSAIAYAALRRRTGRSRPCGTTFLNHRPCLRRKRHVQGESSGLLPLASASGSGLGIHFGELMAVQLRCRDSAARLTFAG